MCRSVLGQDSKPHDAPGCLFCIVSVLDTINEILKNPFAEAIMLQQKILSVLTNSKKTEINCKNKEKASLSIFTKNVLQKHLWRLKIVYILSV